MSIFEAPIKIQHSAHQRHTVLLAGNYEGDTTPTRGVEVTNLSWATNH